MKGAPDVYSVAAWRRLTVDVARAELEVANNNIRETALEAAVGAFAVRDVLLAGFAPAWAAAIVWRGKLASLLLSDSVCRLSPSACTWLINGTVTNAFFSWRCDYLKRLGAGVEPRGGQAVIPSSWPSQHTCWRRVWRRGALTDCPCCCPPARISSY